MKAVGKKGRKRENVFKNMIIMTYASKCKMTDFKIYPKIVK